MTALGQLLNESMAHAKDADGLVSQRRFEALCHDPQDPDRKPQIDLTLPADKSPTAAQRASWRRS